MRHIFSLLNFVINVLEHFQTNSAIHRVNTRNKHHLHRLCVCVCVWVRTHARACMYVYVCVCVMYVCMYVCSKKQYTGICCVNYMRTLIIVDTTLLLTVNKALPLLIFWLVICFSTNALSWYTTIDYAYMQTHTYTRRHVRVLQLYVTFRYINMHILSLHF
jgi:hypothetical protein